MEFTSLTFILLLTNLLAIILVVRSTRNINKKDTESNLRILGEKKDKKKELENKREIIDHIDEMIEGLTNEKNKYKKLYEKAVSKRDQYNEAKRYAQERVTELEIRLSKYDKKILRGAKFK